MYQCLPHQHFLVTAEGNVFHLQNNQNEVHLWHKRKDDTCSYLTFSAWIEERVSNFANWSQNVSTRYRSNTFKFSCKRRAWEFKVCQLARAGLVPGCYEKIGSIQAHLVQARNGPGLAWAWTNAQLRTILRKKPTQAQGSYTALGPRWVGPGRPSWQVYMRWQEQRKGKRCIYQPYDAMQISQ